MPNLDSVLKSRDTTLPTKVCLVKALVFPVVIKWCELDHKESWAWRIDAFELWCWIRLLRAPCTARGSNQSILREISLEYSLEGLMLKLKLQSFVHLMWRADLLEKALMPGKTEGRRRRRQQRMRRVGWHHQLNGHEFEQALGVDGQGSLACCDSRGLKESDTTEQLNWTETLREAQISHFYP